MNRAALEPEEVEGAHGDSPALELDEIELEPEQVEAEHDDSPALEQETWRMKLLLLWVATLVMKFLLA